MIEYLKPGESVSVGNLNHSGGYADYIRVQLHSLAAEIGVTYEQMTGDLSQVNYSSYPASHLELRGLVDAFRWVMLIPMLCKPVWNRFVETGYNAKVIST